MTFDFSSLKFSTKSLIAFLLGLGSLMQIPQVSAPVMAFGQHHPHVAVVLAVLTGIITLLHNPAVDKLLGVTINAPNANITLPPESPAPESK